MLSVRFLSNKGKGESDQSQCKCLRGTRSSGSPKKLIMILYYILHKLFGAAGFEDGEQRKAAIKECDWVRHEDALVGHSQHRYKDA